eukprot:1459259-Rhodomonas_salina.1
MEAVLPCMETTAPFVATTLPFMQAMLPFTCGHNAVMYGHNAVMYGHNAAIYGHNAVMYGHNAAVYEGSADAPGCARQDVRKQILQIMDRHKLDIVSAGTPIAPARVAPYRPRAAPYRPRSTALRVVLCHARSTVARVVRYGPYYARSTDTLARSLAGRWVAGCAGKNYNK